MLDESTRVRRPGDRAPARERDRLADDGHARGRPAPGPGLVPLGRRPVDAPLQPAGKRKLANIAANPKVSLNLDSDGIDADIVICWGEARVSDDPPANEVPAYVEKYAGPIAQLGWTPESFAADFSVPLRIELSRIHGW